MAEDNPSVVVEAFTFQTFAVAVAAGGIAGMAIDLALFPIETIKTRLQASDTKKDIMKQAESVGKYKGLASAVAAAFPCAAMFWLSYEYSKYFIHSNSTLNTYLNVHVQHILASAVAQCCEALVRCPFEVVKQNMQIGQYNTTMEAVNGIWKTKGLIKGFYAGFGPFVLRDIP